MTAGPFYCATKPTGKPGNAESQNRMNSNLAGRQERSGMSGDRPFQHRGLGLFFLNDPFQMLVTVALMIVDAQDTLTSRIQAFSAFRRGFQYFRHRDSHGPLPKARIGSSNTRILIHCIGNGTTKQGKYRVGGFISSAF